MSSFPLFYEVLEKTAAKMIEILESQEFIDGVTIRKITPNVYEPMTFYKKITHVDNLLEIRISQFQNFDQILIKNDCGEIVEVPFDIRGNFWWKRKDKDSNVGKVYDLIFDLEHKLYKKKASPALTSFANELFKKC